MHPSLPFSPDLAFADARNKMVDGQIRPNRVYDPRILAAMRQLPRERFVPAAQLARAYADGDVALGRGRVLMEPMVIARLLQAAAPIPGERALVVASGTGYASAILAACGVGVTALEDDPALLALAHPVLAEFAPSVIQVAAPVITGHADGAPWDIILIEGAVETVPPAIAAQLRHDGGRLLTVRRGHGAGGQAILAEAGEAGLSTRALFDCATTLLPAFRSADAFVF